VLSLRIIGYIYIYCPKGYICEGGYIYIVCREGDWDKETDLLRTLPFYK
jgi:hypothetical protein